MPTAERNKTAGRNRNPRTRPVEQLALPPSERPPLPELPVDPPRQIFEYTRPPMYQKQLDAIFCTERYGIVEASTKAGKTVGCIAWLFEMAYLGEDGQNYWWVAPVYNQAKIAFGRMVKAIPAELVRHVHNGDLVIFLINGTTIFFKSGEKPDGLYGEDVYAAVIDEASRLREEAWHAVRSTLTATRGPVRLIGNVRGRKNFFYALARKAENGAAGMNYRRITAQDAVDAGVLDQEEIDDARTILPEQVFRELYLAIPSDDGGNPFGLQHISKCVQPICEAEPVVWGWDLAKSTDWTVGTALDSFGRVCRFERWQHVPWDDTENRIVKLTAGLPALVDSTGLGDVVLEHLQKKSGGTGLVNGDVVGSNFEGFTFSLQSKQKLMEGLVLAIQGSEISILEGPMKNEIEEFEYQYTRTGVRYSAPEGYHDDCVYSLALANVHRSRAIIAPVISTKLVAQARSHRFTPRAGRLS